MNLTSEDLITQNVNYENHEQANCTNKYLTDYTFFSRNNRTIGMVWQGGYYTPSKPYNV